MSLRLIACVLSMVVISCGTKENYQGQLSAGAAEAIITPDSPVIMLEPRGELSTGTHDELFVRVVALSDGKHEFVIASFDLVGMDDGLVADIKNEIKSVAGLDSEQIMLSCTHTHNVPVTLNAMANYKEFEDRSNQWELKLAKTTANTVKEALDDMSAADLEKGQAPLQLGANRRLNSKSTAAMQPNPFGPSLDESDVLIIKKEEKIKALLFSYAAHPVDVHRASTQFSADYPGFAVQFLTDKYPEAVSLFLQGCAGNINSGTVAGGFAAAERDGQKLGNAVMDAVSNSEKVSLSGIRYKHKRLHLPYMDIDLEIASSIKKRIEESMQTLYQSDSTFKPSAGQQDMLRWSDKLIEISQDRSAYPGLPFEIQAVAFDKSLAIIAFSDEVFVDYALFLKQHSPFDQTIVLAYANGSKSYIPSAESFYLGGYETTYAQQCYNQPFLKPEIDGIIKRESISLLNDLWNKYPN